MTFNKTKFKNISLSILFAISFLLFSFTLGITIILFFRPFFYIQASYLDLPSLTHKTLDELKLAYNTLMDSLLFYKEFSLGGVFKYSEEGMNHFLDCRPLFLLNNIVFLATSIILIILLILRKKKIYEQIKIKSLSLSTYLDILVLIFVLVVLISALIDFNKVFTIFHQIFFPGKDNRLFNPSTDPIIYMFPTEFFINCAIFIGIIFVSLSLIPVILDIIYIIKKKKENKNKLAK